MGAVVAGRKLGDFTLTREVARGGMGIVYEAEQMPLGRKVALKVLPPSAAVEPGKLHRFKLEAQAVSCLNHPNIVPVYAWGEDQGVHFFAMRYVEGKTLAEVLSEIKQGLDGGSRASDDDGRECARR